MTLDLNHFDEKLMPKLPTRPIPPIFALGKRRQENIRSKKKRKGVDWKRREMEGEIGRGQGDYRSSTLSILGGSEGEA